MQDKLAGLADQKHGCGYEAAVLRGPQAELVGDGDSAPPVSACCTSLRGAKAALDAVDEVVWGIAPNWSIKGGHSANENHTAYEPYTFDAAVLHRVLDGVARVIESVQRQC